MPKLNQKGIAHLLVFVILGLGLAATVFLATHPTILKSMASYTTPHKLETFNKLGDALSTYNNSDLGQQIKSYQQGINNLGEQDDLFNSPTPGAYKQLYGEDRVTHLRKAFRIPDDVPDDQVNDFVKEQLKNANIEVQGDVTEVYTVKLPEGCFEGGIDATGNVLPPVCSIDPEVLSNLGSWVLDTIFGDVIRLYKVNKEEQEFAKQINDLFDQSGIPNRQQNVVIDTTQDNDFAIYKKFYGVDNAAYSDSQLTQEQVQARKQIPDVLAKAENTNKAFKGQAQEMAVMGRLEQKGLEVGVSSFKYAAEKGFFSRIGEVVKTSFMKLTESTKNLLDSVFENIRIQEPVLSLPAAPAAIRNVDRSYNVAHLGEKVVRSTLRPSLNTSNANMKFYLNKIDKLILQGKATVLDASWSRYYLDNTLNIIENFRGGSLVQRLPYWPRIRQLSMDTIRNNWVIVVADDEFKRLGPGIENSGAFTAGFMIVIKHSELGSRTLTDVLTHEYFHLISNYVISVIRPLSVNHIGKAFNYSPYQLDIYGKVMSQFYELSTDIGGEMLHDGFQSRYKHAWPQLYNSIYVLRDIVNTRCGMCLSREDFIEFALTADDEVLMKKILAYMSPHEFMQIVQATINTDKLIQVMNQRRSYYRSWMIPVGAAGGAVFFGVWTVEGAELDNNTIIIYEGPVDDEEDVNLLNENSVPNVSTSSLNCSYSESKDSCPSGTQVCTGFSDDLECRGKSPGNCFNSVQCNWDQGKGSSCSCTQ